MLGAACDVRSDLSDVPGDAFSVTDPPTGVAAAVWQCAFHACDVADWLTDLTNAVFSREFSRAMLRVGSPAVWTCRRVTQVVSPMWAMPHPMAQPMSCGSMSESSRVANVALDVPCRVSGDTNPVRDEGIEGRCVS